jgi:hypothetical protein
MKIGSEDDIRSQTDIRTDRCDLQRGRPILLLKVGEKMMESTTETGKCILLENCYDYYYYYYCLSFVKMP